MNASLTGSSSARSGVTIAIIHHHLHPGGVTRVLESQIRALKESVVVTSKNEKDLFNTHCLLLLGHAPDKAVKGVETFIFPDLNYLPNEFLESKELLEKNYQELKDKLKQFVQEHQPAVLHIHNMNLGKNPLVNLAFYELLKEGQFIFNHCHDFAEDARPANVARLKQVFLALNAPPWQEILYPENPNMHFGVINTKDQEFLKSKNIPESRIHFVPNPIAPPEFKKGLREIGECKRILNLDKTKKMVLYPVRLIARKNPAELLLLSILFKDEFQFVVTLPPRNPEEIGAYESWKSFALENKLPVLFEAGEKLEFEELMTMSDFVLSTSSNEGFGLAFLECWLYEKAVAGRDLPQVSTDFRKAGVVLDRLYSCLKVNNHSKDFIEYSDEEKKSLLLELLNSPQKICDFKKQNKLEALFSPCDLNMLKQNKACILKSFSLQAYAHRLHKAYRALLKMDAS